MPKSYQTDLEAEANLFLNGEFSDYSQIINKEFFTIAADGGYRNCLKNGITPNLIYGDLDSLNIDKIEGQYLNLVQKNSDQNTTDFQKCLKLLEEKGFQKINVYCFDGARIDHILAGFSAVLEFKYLEIKLFTKLQVIQKIPKDFRTRAVIGELFSIYPFPKAEKVFYKGLKWNLEGEDLEIGKIIGTSNKALKKEVEIKYKNGNLFLIRNWK